MDSGDGVSTAAAREQPTWDEVVKPMTLFAGPVGHLDHQQASMNANREIV
jgi:hypothetical protein